MSAVKNLLQFLLIFSLGAACFMTLVYTLIYLFGGCQ